MSDLARVVLKPRRARPFFAKHPWVFAGSIARIEASPETGAEVAVYSHEGVFVARGLFNLQSAIRVRLYRWEDKPLDDDFWREQLAASIGWRERLFGKPLDTWDSGTIGRLVFSEADGLSGLTVDLYGSWLVVQFTSLALYLRKDLLVQLLVDRLPNIRGISLRFDKSMAQLEGLTGDPTSKILHTDNWAFGAAPAEPLWIHENGLDFQVDLMGGQKTGFFLDQRENRAAVARFARGRNVLDLFCYSGGFALNCLANGATHAIGIDSSPAAIELARANAVKNHLGQARFENGDVFETLDRMRSRQEKFGLVVCDPPKFARTQKHLDEALKAYLRLNRAAVDVLGPGGILATCSCSGHVDRSLFATMLGQVSELSGRSIQILEQRGQAADHPVSVSCLETEYLKCFICRVE